MYWPLSEVSWEGALRRGRGCGPIRNLRLMADRLNWTLTPEGWRQGDQHFTWADVEYKVKWDSAMHLCKGVAETRSNSKVSISALRCTTAIATCLAAALNHTLRSMEQSFFILLLAMLATLNPRLHTNVWPLPAAVAASLQSALGKLLEESYCGMSFCGLRSSWYPPRES
eukprot:987193-Amphidinium_carterae.3